MQTNVHRTNSDFALQHFLAGSCSTPDGAWALLYGQSLSLKSNLAHGNTHYLRLKAKQLRVEQTEKETPEYYEALAELNEVEANEELMQTNIAGAKQELETVCRLMAELEPQCKYKDKTVLERLELCRQEEWLGELKRRGENMMFSNAIGIPYDHIETMRQHPEFITSILPHLISTANSLKLAETPGDFMDTIKKLNVTPLIK